MDDRLHTIIDNYHKLCDYCDQIWMRVRDAYPNEIACRKGCGICCELQNVNQLEAHVIHTYMDGLTDGPDSGNVIEASVPTSVFPSTDSSIRTNTKSACPFLSDEDQSCRIYPARPTICRTHGLILRSAEFPQPQAASCPYNFPSIHPSDLPAELTVDIDRVTKNLTSLNLAFCMVSGIDARDEGLLRVPLRDVASCR